MSQAPNSSQGAEQVTDRGSNRVGSPDGNSSLASPGRVILGFIVRLGFSGGLCGMEAPARSQVARRLNRGRAPCEFLGSVERLYEMSIRERYGNRGLDPRPPSDLAKLRRCSPIPSRRLRRDHGDPQRSRSDTNVLEARLPRVVCSSTCGVDALLMWAGRMAGSTVDSSKKRLQEDGHPKCLRGIAQSRYGKDPNVGPNF